MPCGIPRFTLGCVGAQRTVALGLFGFLFLTAVTDMADEANIQSLIAIPLLLIVFIDVDDYAYRALN